MFSLLVFYQPPPSCGLLPHVGQLLTLLTAAILSYAFLKIDVQNANVLGGRGVVMRQAPQSAAAGPADYPDSDSDDNDITDEVNDSPLSLIHI